MALLLLAALGCAKPQESPPPEMEDVCRSLLRDFESEEVGKHVEDLGGWLDGIMEDPEDGYVLEGLAEEDVAGLTYSENLDVTTMLGAIVPRRSVGSMDAYAAVVPEEDQSFADSTYERWDRTIVEGTAEGYLAGGDLGTDNEIEKSALFVTLPYRMEKDFRWVETSRGTVQVQRTHVPAEGWTEDGENGIVGGFTVEIWYPDDDGILWVNASWSTLVTAVDGAVTDEDFWINQLIGGTRDYMEGTEAYVNGEER